MSEEAFTESNKVKRQVLFLANQIELGILMNCLMTVIYNSQHCAQLNNLFLGIRFLKHLKEAHPSIGLEVPIFCVNFFVTYFSIIVFFWPESSQLYGSLWLKL